MPPKKQQGKKKHIVFASKGAEREPVAVIEGNYRISHDIIPMANTARLTITAVNEGNEFEAAILQSEDLVKLVASEGTVVPFAGESGHTFYLMANSTVSIKGVLAMTCGGNTSIKNGLQTVMAAGNCRLYILPGMAAVIVLTGIIDYQDKGGTSTTSVMASQA